jgi:hypothetical protein
MAFSGWPAPKEPEMKVKKETAYELSYIVVL